MQLEQNAKGMEFFEEIQREVLHNQKVLSESINQIGYGAYQKQLFLLCGMGKVTDFMYLKALSVMHIPIQNEFKLTNAGFGYIGACLSIGMLAGAAFWGFSSDIYGRKPAFNYTLIITSVFSLAAAFAPNLYVLSLLLLCMGFGAGGNLPIDGTIFIEFVGLEHQSKLIVMCAFESLGQFITSFLALLIIPVPGLSCTQMEGCTMDENYGWRILQMSLGLVTLLTIVARVLFFHLGETPKFLVSRGRFSEAVEVLHYVAEKNGTKALVRVSDFKALPADSKKSPKMNETMTQTLYRTLRIMFSKELRVTTILLGSLTVSMAFGNTMFFGFLPRYLSLMGAHPSLKDIYKNLVIVSLISIPGSFAGMYLSDSIFGRKLSMVWAAIGISLLILAFSTVESSASILLITSAAGFLQSLKHSVMYSYLHEVYPTEVRGTAGAVVHSVGKISGIAAPLIGGYLMDISYKLPLYLSASMLSFTALIIFCLPIETRDVEAH